MLTPDAERDPALRIEQLEAELRATRQDHREKLSRLAARNGGGSAVHAPADRGLYELLIEQERERERLHQGLHAEHAVRLAAEAERDELALAAAERDRLALALEEARQWAAVLEERARRLETSLSWRIGNALLAPWRRLPGAPAMRRLVRLARRR